MARQRRDGSDARHRLTVDRWLERTRHRPSQITRQEIIDMLDDLRGEWSDTSG